jgi:hypothetical protein
MLGSFPALLGQVDPQDLLALLQSATQVREAGPASGPGWTGSAYTFTAATTLTGPVHTPVNTSGTVDVDQQGQIRQVDALESFGHTVRKVEITFGGFGIPVVVSAPPASETFSPRRLRDVPTGVPVQRRSPAVRRAGARPGHRVRRQEG